VLVAALVIWLTEGAATKLTADAFRILVLLALVPGLLAIATIVVGVRDVPRSAKVPPAAAPVAAPAAAPVAAPAPAPAQASAPVAAPAFSLRRRIVGDSASGAASLGLLALHPRQRTLHARQLERRVPALRSQNWA